MSWSFATGVVFQSVNDCQYLRASLYKSCNLRWRINTNYTDKGRCLMILASIWQIFCDYIR